MALLVDIYRKREIESDGVLWEGILLISTLKKTLRKKNMKKINVILLVSVLLLLTTCISCASTVHCDAYGQIENIKENENES